MQISAFVDGELPDAEADLLLRRMGQDAALRRQVAEYLEIGRVMRGEPGVAGMERLQERIAAAIDERPVDDGKIAIETAPGRSIKPLAGIAVAASVALIALFGLQLTSGVDEAGEAPDNAIAEVVEEPGYTVPQPLDEQLRQYYLSHSASSSEMGANGMNARLVTLRFSDETVVEEDETADGTAGDTADEESTQP